MARLPLTAILSPPRSVLGSPSQGPHTSARARPFGRLRIEPAAVVIAGLLGTRRLPIRDVVFVRTRERWLHIETASRVHRVRLDDAEAADRIATTLRERVAASGNGARFDGGV